MVSRNTSSNVPVLLPSLVLAVVLFVFWLLIGWPVSPIDGRILWGDVANGIVVALLAAVVMPPFVTGHFKRLLDPRRYASAAAYLVVFAWYVARGNIDVAYRVLHPTMPIRPGIVKAKTTLRSTAARALLANSITLTPGTLTVDIVEDVFYIHCINVHAGDEDVFAREILTRFEGLIARILE